MSSSAIHVEEEGSLPDAAAPPDKAKAPLRRLLFASNEPRARFLLEELRRSWDVAGLENFDDIDALTKYTTAALTFRKPRVAWWRAYQMHPLLQRRRRRVLQHAMRRHAGPVDALFMWGSWFHPTRGWPAELPFFQYIDESLSPDPPGATTAFARRTHRRSFELQAQNYAACAGIFCMSEWAHAQTLAAHPGCAGKLHVVGWGPCGVDLSEEEIDEKLRRPLVLHVSNDFKRKGVDFLVQTAARVRARLPLAEFVVIGRTGDFDQRPAGGLVRFVGPVYDRQELSRYFREASLFFLPHRFDRSPHVLVEAMSAGLPIVASRQGGCTELVEGQDTGWAFPIGDIQGYAGAIESLLVDRTLRARKGAAARRLMREKYSWPTVAERITAIMTRVLAK